MSFRGTADSPPRPLKTTLCFTISKFMDQKIYIWGIFIFGIIFHLFARGDKGMKYEHAFYSFVSGVAMVCLGIVTAYLDKGLKVVVNNLTMEHVEFPGHSIPFGYALVICSLLMTFEITIRKVLKLKKT